MKTVIVPDNPIPVGTTVDKTLGWLLVLSASILPPAVWAQLPFRRGEIERECAAYVKAFNAVVEKCRKKVELQAGDYDRLRESVAVLQKAVETAVPHRDNQRVQARDYVRRLDEASKIFAEQSYAEQLIRDVSEHKATTVGALLAFMRDYRLLFSDPGNSPEVTALYDGLYGLLRRQKDALGMRPPGPSAGEAFQPGTIWVNVDSSRPMRLRVMERTGGRFKAVVRSGKDLAMVREITGAVGADALVWSNREARVLKGPQPKAKAKGQNATTHGTFKGNEIHLTISGPRGPINSVPRKSP